MTCSRRHRHNSVTRAKVICRERCAVMGEPACWEVEGFEGFDKCTADARCIDLAKATMDADAKELGE